MLTKNMSICLKSMKVKKLAQVIEKYTILYIDIFLHCINDQGID